MLPRAEERAAVRVRAVREPVGNACRLHHHGKHQHDRGEAGELLPPVRIQRDRLRGVRKHVHGGVRPDAAASLPASKPPQHRLALRGGRRHLLWLLLHQPRPLRRQVGLPRRRAWHPRRRRHRRAPRQGLQRPPRPRQHCLLLHLRRRAHRDPGHAQVASRREQDHEARVALRSQHDHHLLPLARLHRLRCLRKRRPREHPHRLRILRALLARRHRQRLRHRAPRRRLPGVRAAHLREAGELRGVPVAGLQDHHCHLLRARSGPAVHFCADRAAQAGAPHRHHHVHHARGDAAAVFQRRAGAHRRARLLAALRLLPRRHARRQARDQAQRGAVVVASGHELRLPPHLPRCQHRVCAGHRAQPKDSHALQDCRLIHQLITAFTYTP